jgi:hypothetical protein
VKIMSREEKVKHWRAVIKKHAESGLSAAAFCRERHISIHQFRWWRRRFKKEVSQGKESRFLKLVPFSQPQGGGIRIRLNGGIFIEVDQGFDPHTLCSVIEAIRGGEATSCSR